MNFCKQRFFFFFLDNQFTTIDAIAFLKQINSKYASDVDMFDPDQINKLNYSSKMQLLNNIYNAANSEIFFGNFTDEEKKRLPCFHEVMRLQPRPIHRCQGESSSQSEGKV